ncbi:caffeic acid 3-O-methyltransferase-like [Euphorbia lathyris]|uniref:caffeic acid 3-O-methyltransferase-like n=1 Tax=Euphorbia lathyris TaxID=212925 RepID=UPI00331429DC
MSSLDLNMETNIIEPQVVSCKESNSMGEHEEEEEEEMGKVAVRLANAAVLPLVLKSAIELNLINIIFKATSDGFSLSPCEIAARIPTKNPDAPFLLDRMLRLLASYDILLVSESVSDGELKRVYSAAPICKFLTWNQSEEGESVAPLFLLHHDEVFMKSWYHLNDVILDGGIPFNRAYGMTNFEYLGTDQRFNKVFNQAMSNHTALIAKKILHVYKGFDGLKVLVDVGGGNGVTLNLITSKYPQIKGINFDLPHVLADAPSFPGVEHVGGDMFISVPKGDAVFMKWILHGWSDEYCLKLLQKCWEAIPSKGKVIVVESVLAVEADKSNSVSTQIVFEQDMFMLAQTSGGMERTLKDYHNLAINSGFTGCQLICSAYNTWVMEFHKQ